MHTCSSLRFELHRVLGFLQDFGFLNGTFEKSNIPFDPHYNFSYHFPKLPSQPMRHRGREVNIRLEMNFIITRTMDNGRMGNLAILLQDVNQALYRSILNKPSSAKEMPNYTPVDSLFTSKQRSALLSIPL